MGELSIGRALTFDRHFAQAGFEVLPSRKRGLEILFGTGVCQRLPVCVADAVRVGVVEAHQLTAVTGYQ